jgi:hypothetical protein
MARLLAADLSERIGADADSNARFIGSAFESVLGRPPNKQELKDSLEYLKQQAELYSQPQRLEAFTVGEAPDVAASKEPAQRARESLAHVLFNHSEFVAVRCGAAHEKTSRAVFSRQRA